MVISGLPELPHMARYALSAAVELAQHDPEHLVSSMQLAETAEAPKAMMAKVLGALAHAGVVEGRKGHHGGYRLARPASEIKLIEVVGVFSEGSSRPACALMVRQCNPNKPCALHDRWEAALAGMDVLFRNTSLAQVVGRTG